MIPVLKNNHWEKILLLVFMIIGIITYKDYGISWDEETQRNTGLHCYNYVFNNDKSMLTWADRDYGVAFELPLIVIEKALGLTELKDIFHLRHIATYLFFLLGAWSIFLLGNLLFKNKTVAIIAMLLYLLHPRIFADSFYNTKDIPFLSMFSICMFWSAKAFESRRSKHFILLGVLLGLLINIRLMGVMLFGIILMFLFIDVVTNLLKSKKFPYQVLYNGIYLILFTVITLYITWPFLWTAPWHNFSFAFANMSNFRWDYDVLFEGQLTKSTQLPWYYIPYWIVISTPISYLLLGISGVFLSFYLICINFQKFLNNNIERNILLFIASVFIPLLAIILLKSVVYDAWRQVFFIYPSFVMLCALLIHKLSRIFNQKIVFAICFLFIAVQAFTIFQLHPFENVYFNEFVSKDTDYIHQHFEQDYWGLSSKQALDCIIKNDPSPVLKIAGDAQPIHFNLLVLFNNTRLQKANLDSADYFITFYRARPDIYKEFVGKEYYSIIKNNSSILTVYKLKAN